MDNTPFTPENDQINNFSSSLENQNPPKKTGFSLVKKIVIIAVVILIGIIAYAGIWYSQKNQISTIDNSGIENWKTYTNKQYGFEFKHPTSIPIKESYFDENNPTRLVIDFNPPESWCSDCGGPSDYLKIIVSLENPTPCSGPQSESVIISGVENEKCLNPGSYFGEGTGIFINFKQGKYTYFFNADFYDKNKKEVDQILSTFKFTDANMTGNWKTYTNKQYGFEFKYPPNFNTPAQKTANFSLKLIDTKTCGMIELEGGTWPKDCIIYNLGIQKNNIWNSENSTIIEIAGRSMERIEINDGMWESSNQTIYQFAKGSDWFINSLTFNSENKTMAENIFRQILSTFKFTE
jgi:hypothetical protein